MDQDLPPSIAPPPEPTQLIVFADDWGRHPSSSQHLIRELLPHYPTLWVNTVGTRRPRLSRSDLARAMGVVSGWLGPSVQGQPGSPDRPAGLEVIAPRMYPGYRRAWQRRFNAKQVAQLVREHLLPGHRIVVVTTLPTTADLVDRLPVDRWLYYCVDDYAKWPGTDHAVMEQMQRALVTRVDEAIAVSDVLAQRLTGLGKTPTQLSHGVDLNHWQSPSADSMVCDRWPSDDLPIAMFWGLLDERLDSQWVLQLVKAGRARVVLAGPQDGLQGLGVGEVLCTLTGRIPFKDLPAHAASSQVLIMPYIDAAVTRAMQPLKLLEYLATMKPVVVRDLPSTRAWADCCDLAATAEEFVRLVRERIKTGTPPEQIEARKRRLAGESWTAKAAQLAKVINAGSR